MKRAALLRGTALPSPNVFGRALPDQVQQGDVVLNGLYGDEPSGVITAEELRLSGVMEPSRAERRRNRVGVVVHAPNAKGEHPVTSHKLRRRR